MKVNWKEIIGEEWEYLLREEIEKEYFQNLLRFLHTEYSTKKIYPEKKDVFKAFWLCQPADIKVVILGQDVYHTPNTAHGLAFSSLQEKTPPSLRNIFKEIENDLGNGLVLTHNNNLTYLAYQGVFLLNTILTVEEGKPLSHAGKGWEIFIKKTIEQLIVGYSGIVFLAWGNNALNLLKEVDEDNFYLQTHVVLTAAHPSPLSASRGFFGCKHFSKTNEYLKSVGKEEIKWI